MYRILCIGDAHVPIRAKDLLPQMYKKLNELTQTSLFDYTFFTGDVVNFPKLIKFLKLKTRKNFFKVIGNMDYYYGDRNSPKYQELVISFEDNDELTLGLTHGSQIKPRGDRSQLENLAIEKEYIILITGHTHKEEVFLTKKGILLINPGSVTGAWSFVASGIPSFIIICIDEKLKEIIIKLFQIDKQTSEIIISKSYFTFRNNRIYKKL